MSKDSQPFRGGLASSGRQAVWCPDCGARSNLDPSHPFPCCAGCGGALLPREQGTEHRQTWLDGQRRCIRGERRAALWMQSYTYLLGGRGCLVLFALAGFGALGLLALFGMFQPDARLIFVAAITAVATLLSVRAMARFRRCRGAGWPQIQDLVDRHGGRRLRRFSEVLAWLNVHWPSYYSPFFLASSAEADYATLTRDHVRVMINMHLQADQRGGALTSVFLDAARLHLLLAAPLDHVHDEAPDEPAWTDDASPMVARLEELGFTAQARASGILIQATAESVREFRSGGGPAARLESVLEQGLGLLQVLQRR